MWIIVLESRKFLYINNKYHSIIKKIWDSLTATIIHSDYFLISNWWNKTSSLVGLYSLTQGDRVHNTLPHIMRNMSVIDMMKISWLNRIKIVFMHKFPMICQPVYAFYHNWATKNSEHSYHILSPSIIRYRVVPAHKPMLNAAQMAERIDGMMTLFPG